MQLNIVFPVHNERNSIDFVLKGWKQELDKQNITYSFIVCEDGSTDGTKELLIQLKEKYPLKLDLKQKRRGYGTAVIDGIKASNSDYILCVDSDGQCDPKDFPKFWNDKEKANVIIGWRKKRADKLQRRIFSSLFKVFFMILFPTPIHDPSAPFVIFKKNAIMPYLHQLVYLKEGFWWGFVGMCVKNSLTMQEIPINHRGRISGTTQVYKIKNMLGIAMRNTLGLFRLKLAK
jgi:dolichol-phosphate mannosyltransferase